MEGEEKKTTVKVWYPFQAAKDLDVNFKLINIVNNGLDYIVPAVDRNIHKMTSKFGLITESINAGIMHCESMISCLPNSQLMTAVESIERHQTRLPLLHASQQEQQTSHLLRLLFL